MIDYKQLTELLVEHLWQDAEEETKRIVRDVAEGQVGFLTDDRLYIEHISSFECEHLHQIDRLWTTHSNGHFGWSVQKKVFSEFFDLENIEFDMEKWCEFTAKMGWYFGEPEKTIYDLDRAPPGHLPWILCNSMLAFDSFDGFVYAINTGRIKGIPRKSLFTEFFIRLHKCGL